MGQGAIPYEVEIDRFGMHDPRVLIRGFSCASKNIELFQAASMSSAAQQFAGRTRAFLIAVMRKTALRLEPPNPSLPRNCGRAFGQVMNSMDLTANGMVARSS
mgnify:CR=1 FL=1